MEAGLPFLSETVTSTLSRNSGADCATGEIADASSASTYKYLRIIAAHYTGAPSL